MCHKFLHRVGRRREVWHQPTHQLVSVFALYHTPSGLPATAMLSPHADIAGGQGAHGGQCFRTCSQGGCLSCCYVLLASEDLPHLC